MTTTFSRRQALSTLGALTLCTATGVHAHNSWPNRPIKIIVGYASGGPSDVTARMLSQRLTIALGQPVVVENRPGAGANIAFEAVAAAPPDGYTLMLTTVTLAMNPHLYKAIKWDPKKSFRPIVNCMTSPSVLALASTLPSKNLNDFLTLAKREPGKHSFASTGVGGTAHLAGLMLEQQAAIDLIHVAYKGVAPAMNDLLGGQVDAGFLTAMGAVEHLRKGNPRPVAVAASGRLPALPDVPTFTELGYPGMIVESWNGLIAPAGTPTAIIERLNQEVNKALASAEMQASLVKMGGVAVGGSVADFQQYIDDELNRWGRVMKAAKVTLE